MSNGIVLTDAIRSSLLSLQNTGRDAGQGPGAPRHRQEGQLRPRQPDQLLHRRGPEPARQRPLLAPRRHVERHQDARGRRYRHERRSPRWSRRCAPMSARPVRTSRSRAVSYTHDTRRSPPAAPSRTSASRAGRSAQRRSTCRSTRPRRVARPPSPALSRAPSSRRSRPIAGQATDLSPPGRDHGRHAITGASTQRPPRSRRRSTPPRGGDGGSASMAAAVSSSSRAPTAPTSRCRR